MENREGEHIVSLEELSIGHPHSPVLLSQIHLSVEAGEMVALIGRNGTGKSTLLKTMIGLLPSRGGRCHLEGKSVAEYDLPDRARQVSFVSSQSTYLPSLTVKELVSLGRLPHTGWTGRLGPGDIAMVEEALEKVQLGPFAHRPLDRLSDGERQRAMMARAFAQDTRLMVLDEPTAFLDIPNTFDLISLLSRFRDGGKSIVYSTHDLETALLCADKLWVIHQGKVLEGSPEDLGLSGLFDELFLSSGIRYDDQSGRFLFHGDIVDTVRLEGEAGPAFTWTRNALERLGYRVDPKGTLHIRIGHSGKDPRWILEQEDGPVTFHSIYKLARFLVQAK